MVRYRLTKERKFVIIALVKFLKYFGEEDYMFKRVIKVVKQNLSPSTPPEIRMVSLVFNSRKSHFLHINKKLLIKNSMVAVCQPWVFLFSNPNVEKVKK